MKVRRNARVLFFGLACMLSGCGSDAADEAQSEEDISSPAVPVPGTMALDLSVHTNSEDFSEYAAFALQSRGLNYVKGMLTVAAVNLNVASSLVIPVKFLREAQNAKAELVAEDSYIWSFDFSYNSVDWTGNLSGVRSPTETTSHSWSMVVEREPADANGCCEEFVLFTGETTAQGVGSWQIFDPRDPAGDARLFAIEYDISDPDLKEIQFEINSDRPAEQNFGQGSTITYQATKDTVSLIVKNSVNAGAATTVEWNRSTKAGSIESLSGERDCWDTEETSYADIDC